MPPPLPRQRRGALCQRRSRRRAPGQSSAMAIQFSDLQQAPIHYTLQVIDPDPVQLVSTIGPSLISDTPSVRSSKFTVHGAADGALCCFHQSGEGPGSGINEFQLPTGIRSRYGHRRQHSCQRRQRRHGRKCPFHNGLSSGPNAPTWRSSLSRLIRQSGLPSDSFERTLRARSADRHVTTLVSGPDDPHQEFTGGFIDTPIFSGNSQFVDLFTGYVYHGRRQRHGRRPIVRVQPRDRCNRHGPRVSVHTGTDGSMVGVSNGTVDSYEPTVAADGQLHCFPKQTPATCCSIRQVTQPTCHVRDMQAAVTSLVSVTSTGSPAPAAAGERFLHHRSADG